MKLEIISKDFSGKGLLFNSNVGCVIISSSLKRADEQCLNILSSGGRSSRCCSFFVEIKAGRFEQERFFRIQHIWLKVLCFSPKIKNRIFKDRINVIQRRGAILSGIFPGSLNVYTLFFYRALLKLLAVKCVSRKKIPIFEKGAEGINQFVRWISYGAKGILTVEEYRNFKNRIDLDIINPVDILRKKTKCLNI